MGETALEAVVAQARFELREMIRTGQEARERLITENEGMIHKIVYRVAKGHPELSEHLLSIAYEQFIRCMDRTFSLEKGAEFSTYVYRCMMTQCLEAAVEFSQQIRIPSAVLTQMKRDRKSRASLSHGRETIYNVVEQSTKLISLDQSTSHTEGEEDLALIDRLGDNGFEGLEAQLALRYAVRKAVSQMSSRNQFVFRLRYG